VFSEDFDSEWPDGGHFGGWPPMGLKPADAVFYHQRAPLQKVNKARRQREYSQFSAVIKVGVMQFLNVPICIIWFIAILQNY
jgi:hypothetical protein